MDTALTGARRAHACARDARLAHHLDEGAAASLNPRQCQLSARAHRQASCSAIDPSSVAPPHDPIREKSRGQPPYGRMRNSELKANQNAHPPPGRPGIPAKIFTGICPETGRKSPAPSLERRGMRRMTHARKTGWKRGGSTLKPPPPPDSDGNVGWKQTQPTAGVDGGKTPVPPWNPGSRRGNPQPAILPLGHTFRGGHGTPAPGLNPPKPRRPPGPQQCSRAGLPGWQERTAAAPGYARLMQQRPLSPFCRNGFPSNRNRPPLINPTGAALHPLQQPDP